MRLLLSSNGWRDNKRIGEEFVRLTGKKPEDIKVFLVTTAAKGSPDWEHVGLVLKDFEKVGIPKENIFIFSFDKKVKDSYLEEIDAIYICGGNTFHYLEGIRKTGLDEKIKKLVKKGILYFGVSAGSIVAGPDIGVICSPEKNDIGLRDLTGLNLTDVVIAPHMNRKGEKKDFVEGVPYEIFPLTDQQALLIKNGEKKLIE